MKVLFSDRFTRSFETAPDRVQREFGKQLGFLLRNLRHASLRAKKYDESDDIWQARVNDDRRFYFRIESNTYHLVDIMSHPK
jgi:mRNA-degrading endonuclease RelE of RelBE toxin-antitoxin system